MKDPTTLALACGLLSCPFLVRADIRLVMFRHAENPAAGLGQPSCQTQGSATPKVEHVELDNQSTACPGG